MGRSLKKGPYIDERLEKRVEELAATLDDLARVRGPHPRGAQRQEVHPGLHHREHGGTPAGRVRAHPHLQGPRTGREGLRVPDRQGLIMRTRATTSGAGGWARRWPR